MKTKLIPINITTELKEILSEGFKWLPCKSEYGQVLLYLLGESKTYNKIKEKVKTDKEFIKTQMENSEE